MNIKPNGFRKRTAWPSRQASKNAKALEKHLRADGWTGRVEAVIVVPRGCRVEVKNPTVPVITRDRLAKYVRWLGGETLT